MNWEKKKVLVVVKAYPESSKKHGSVVCTAGITEDSEWIRIYPIPFEYFRGNKRIPKYTWIEADVKKASEKLSRKESYRIRDGSIKIVDESLNKPRPNWKERNRVILSTLRSTVEDLQFDFNENKTSLGMIKPGLLHDFNTTKPLEEIDDDIIKGRQMTIYGEERTLLEDIPHIFKYKFSCTKNCICEHYMTCEDWELFQSYRKWRWDYPTKKILWEKIRERYFDWMKNRNLHFLLGTHSMYPVWMIIGLYYPPKTI